MEQLEKNFLGTSGKHYTLFKRVTCSLHTDTESLNPEQSRENGLELFSSQNISGMWKMLVKFLVKKKKLVPVENSFITRSVNKLLTSKIYNEIHSELSKKSFNKILIFNYHKANFSLGL